MMRLIKSKRISLRQQPSVYATPKHSEQSAEDKKSVLEIQTQVNNLTEKSLQSTETTKELCEEIQRLGVSIITYLEMSGLQVGNVKQSVDKLHQKLEQAIDHLDELETPVVGGCCGTWRRRRKNMMKQLTGLGMDITLDDAKHADPPYRKGNDERFITRITYDDREEQMERNMEEVNEMIENLKFIALDISNLLNKQYKNIDETSGKSKDLEEDIVDAHKQANRILKS